jgi:hypothetical protein
MTVIPALRRLRLEDFEFKDSVGYIVRACSTERERERPHPRQPRTTQLVIFFFVSFSGILLTLPRGKGVGTLFCSVYFSVICIFKIRILLM